MDKITIIILAAGNGSRMNNKALPKVLLPLHGKPMVQYMTSAIEQAAIVTRPIVVIGKHAEKVQSTLGQNFEYVLQSEQLGTGHAVQCVKEQIQSMPEGPVLILYGDHPFITPGTIKRITQQHTSHNAVLTLTTVNVPEEGRWSAHFSGNGRIIRNQDGKIITNVEAKDATPKQLAIRERNASYACFDKSWLWSRLDQLSNNNEQKEYYLTDLIGIAFSEGATIADVTIEPKEALGINTPEEFEGAIHAL